MTPPPKEVVGSKQEGSNVYPLLGGIQLGLSALSFGAGLVFYFNAKSSFEDAQSISSLAAERMRNEIEIVPQDETDFRAAVDSVKTNQTLNIAFYSLGTALLISGVIFLLIPEGEESASTEQGTRWDWYVAPNGAGVAGTF